MSRQYIKRGDWHRTMGEWHRAVRKGAGSWGMAQGRKEWRRSMWNGPGPCGMAQSRVKWNWIVENGGTGSWGMAQTMRGLYSAVGKERFRERPMSQWIWDQKIFTYNPDKPVQYESCRWIVCSVVERRRGIMFPRVVSLFEVRSSAGVQCSDWLFKNDG